MDLFDFCRCRVPRVFLASLVICILAGQAAADTDRSPNHDYEAPEPGSYRLPVIKRAADGALLNTSGQPVRLGKLTHGKIAVISFIYTRCAAANACPMATGVMMQLHRESSKDPTIAKHLCLVSMSFDPVHDTQKRMTAYSSLANAHTNAAQWHFVTAQSRETLQPILDAYGQAVDEKQNPNDPTGPLKHTLRVFLVDAQGQIRNIYSSGTLDPRLVMADIRTLILERN